jgi:FkbM family methyltransferase
MKRLAKRAYESIPLKREIFTVAKRFIRPGERIYRHLHFQGDFLLAVDEEHVFKIRHYGYEIENTLFWGGLEGGWEAFALSVWMKLSKDAKTIIDVGANTGIYSLVAKCINAEARVVAIEPIERVFRRLSANVELNSYDIECIMIALSDRDGEETIFDEPGEHTYSASFHREIFGSPNIVGVMIPIRKFETLATELGMREVDLIKLDVEGHEPQVLAGFGRILETTRASFLIEVLTDEIGEKVRTKLGSHGYRFFFLDEKNKALQPVERLTRRLTYNYVAVHKSRLGLIKNNQISI